MSGEELLSRLWKLHRAVLRDAAPCLHRQGVVPAAFFALAKVAERPHPSALAEALGLPRPSVSRLLRRLERLGWLRREADPADLRRYRLYLTEEGRRALEAARRCLAQALETRLARLTPGEREQLGRLLSVLLSEEG